MSLLKAQWRCRTCRKKHQRVVIILVGATAHWSGLQEVCYIRVYSVNLFPFTLFPKRHKNTSSTRWCTLLHAFERFNFFFFDVIHLTICITRLYGKKHFPANQFFFLSSKFHQTKKVRCLSQNVWIRFLFCEWRLPQLTATIQDFFFFFSDRVKANQILLFSRSTGTLVSECQESLLLGSYMVCCHGGKKNKFTIQDPELLRMLIKKKLV